MIPITQPIKPDLKEYNGYIKDIFNSGQLTNNGKYLRALEFKLKVLMDVKNNAIFNNGTIALMVALKSLDLSGSVITTPFTFPATINAIEWNGLKPVFCDIDYDTMNITPEMAQKHINDSVSAILPVHVFGTPCDVYGFEELTEDYNLKLIYDAAHAFNTKINNVSIGNFGDITMFSFHPTKLFHTGEGGMLTYNDNNLDKAIKQLRNFGIKDENTGSTMSGLNGKLNELQASLGICILKKIKEEIKRRKKISELYYFYLSDIPWLKFLKTEKNVQNSFQYFPVRIKKIRNKIYEDLKDKNIFSRKYFHPLCNNSSNTPNAVKVSEEILCLPFYGELTEREIRDICKIILKGDNI